MLEGKAVHRVVFYEITKSAVQEAIEQPREIAEELVNAQQARRALDYLVGFNLSPLLWKKVRRPALSAGRVQSPALRMICEREDEIAAFKAQEYWTIDAEAETGRARRSPRGSRSSAARRSSSSRSRTRRRRAKSQQHARGTRPQRQAARSPASTEAAQAQSVAAVHDLDAAAGSRAQARLRRAAHDAHSRSSYTKAWTSAKARSASSPTCAPTR